MSSAIAEIASIGGVLSVGLELFEPVVPLLARGPEFLAIFFGREAQQHFHFIIAEVVAIGPELFVDLGRIGMPFHQIQGYAFACQPGYRLRSRPVAERRPQ